MAPAQAERVMGARHRRRLRPPAWLEAVAGPALIVVAVLLVLRDLAFGGLLTFQHIDILPQWLPTYCYLGKSIASAHIPTWNLYVMGGVPSAADPESGWGLSPCHAPVLSAPLRPGDQVVHRPSADPGRASTGSSVARASPVWPARPEDSCLR